MLRSFLSFYVFAIMFTFSSCQIMIGNLSDAMFWVVADFFRGSVVKNICLSGIEHVICVTAVNERFYIRNYRSELCISGTTLRSTIFIIIG